MEYTKTVTVKRTYNVEFYPGVFDCTWANLYSGGNTWESQHRNLRPVLFVAGIWP